MSVCLSVCPDSCGISDGALKLSPVKSSRRVVTKRNFTWQFAPWNLWFIENWRSVLNSESKGSPLFSNLVGDGSWRFRGTVRVLRWGSPYLHTIFLLNRDGETFSFPWGKLGCQVVWIERNEQVSTIRLFKPLQVDQCLGDVCSKFLVNPLASHKPYDLHFIQALEIKEYLR
jgi:hypothetical protein